MFISLNLHTYYFNLNYCFFYKMKTGKVNLVAWKKWMCVCELRKCECMFGLGGIGEFGVLLNFFS